MKKTDSLTEKEQEQLLNDLFMMEAVVVGYRAYCKKIGKEKESKDFVREFMDGIMVDPKDLN